jgi:peptide/nickel transport system permease protein
MSFLIYGLIGLMPGDPIDIMVNSNPGYTAQDVARLRAQYGLDQPLTTRYWHWLQPPRPWTSAIRAPTRNRCW